MCKISVALTDLKAVSKLANVNLEAEPSTDTTPSSVFTTDITNQLPAKN